MSPRKEAHLRGDKTYVDGNPCKSCGLHEKYVSSYQCVSCSRKKLDDVDLMASYRTVEKQRQKLRNWRKENPEKYKEQGKTPKARVSNCAKAARYRTRKRQQLPPTANNHAIKAIYYECRRISEETGIPHEVDHIIPVSKGGLHEENNLQIITRTENRAKGSRHNG